MNKLKINDFSLDTSEDWWHTSNCHPQIWKYRQIPTISAISANTDQKSLDIQTVTDRWIKAECELCRLELKTYGNPEINGRAHTYLDFTFSHPTHFFWWRNEENTLLFQVHGEASNHFDTSLGKKFIILKYWQNILLNKDLPSKGN